MRYRSRPQEVEAVQWTGSRESANECIRFVGCPDGVDYGFLCEDAGTDRAQAFLRAGKGGAQGFVPLPVGQWIVRQPDDLTDHWPVDDEYFRNKYEPVNQNNYYFPFWGIQ